MRKLKATGAARWLMSGAGKAATFFAGQDSAAEAAAREREGAAATQPNTAGTQQRAAQADRELSSAAAAESALPAEPLAHRRQQQTRRTTW